jgi:HEAT repeat protein
MANFEIRCLPDLLPSLRHQNRHIRLSATEILRSMVCREVPRHPEAAFPPEVVELLLAELASEPHSAIRASAAEAVACLTSPRATGTLRELLHDRQWIVRLRTVQALAYRQRDIAGLCLDLQACLLDPHWRVREAAIRTLISLGEKGKRQLYEHFLTSRDRTICAQVVEVIERSGLMSALVGQYTAGTKGVDAIMVEQLASEAAPLGLSGVLRTLDADTRRKFLDRFLPYTEAKMRFLGDPEFNFEHPFSLQRVLEFPATVAD